MTRRKTCRKCKRRRETNYFYRKARNKDGHMNVCKECQRGAVKERFEIKVCNKCGEPKPMTAFYKNPITPDGRKYTCIACCKHEYEFSKAHHHCGNGCVFMETCQVRVMSRDEQYWDWDPPCFVSSKYHEAYVNEYARRVAV